MAYRVALPPSLAGVHHVFHVSQLRKCLSDDDVVIDTHRLKIQPNLIYAERPMKLLDRKEKVLRTKDIKYVKDLQSGQTKWEAT